MLPLGLERLVCALAREDEHLAFGVEPRLVTELFVEAADDDRVAAHRDRVAGFVVRVRLAREVVHLLPDERIDDARSPRITERLGRFGARGATRWRCPKDDCQQQPQSPLALTPTRIWLARRSGTPW